jgi:hypothetical protein
VGEVIRTTSDHLTATAPSWSTPLKLADAMNRTARKCVSLLGVWKPLGLCAVPLRFNANGRAASMVIPPFASVGEQLPVDLYHSEQERRADAEQQRAVHRF